MQAHIPQRVLSDRKAMGFPALQQHTLSSKIKNSCMARNWILTCSCFVLMLTAGYFTVILIFAFLPLKDLAVMVAVPFFLAFTLPEAETAATFLLLVE